MARRVSFGRQAARWNEAGEDADAPLMPQQSVFARLGPKLPIPMGDPPYVPASVEEPPLAGMIFGCTSETYRECMNRQLFGLPASNKPQVMRIAPGASLFLFNFRTKCMYGIFEATSYGGMQIVREAFGGKFGAQVKVRLAEDCPPVGERDFKEAIRANYMDAHKFKFQLNETQVCRLKSLFRERIAEERALLKGHNNGHRIVQFHSPGHQQVVSSIQVQRRVEIVSKNESEVPRTVHISAPPVVSSWDASSSHPSKGLEVFIFPKEKKDRNRSVKSGSPSRFVVMYDARKEQSTTPVLRSKITRLPREKAVKEVYQSRSSRGISQDRKRHADSSPNRGRIISKLFLSEQEEERDQLFGEGISDLRDLLNYPQAKLSKISLKESSRRPLSRAMDSPVDINRGVSFKGNLKGDSKGGLPAPRKKCSRIALESLKATSSKDLVISNTSIKAVHVEEARKEGKTIGPTENVLGILKSASVCSDVRNRLLQTSVSDCAEADIVPLLGPSRLPRRSEKGDVLDSCRKEIGNHNANWDAVTATSDGVGVGGCEESTTNLFVEPGVLQSLNNVIVDSDMGEQSKVEGLDIYVSLAVDKPENARQTISQLVPGNLHATGDPVRCLLGKRPRESEQHEDVLGSSTQAQSLHTESPDQQLQAGLKECHRKGSISKVLKFAANVFKTHQGMEQRNFLSGGPDAEEQRLTVQVNTKNGGPRMENLSEEGMRVDHVEAVPSNIPPLKDAIPVLSTTIPDNTGDVRPLDCKRYKAEKEKGPLSPIQKWNMVGHDAAGCSYFTPEVLTHSEGSDMLDNALQKYGMACDKPLQISAHSSCPKESGNPWNYRTLRYGRPCSSDTSPKHGRRPSKSRSDSPRTFGKSESNVESMQIGEVNVYSGGENYGKQLESPNATEASRNSGRFKSQSALLVCELGNPGGLSLDCKMIRTDTDGDVLRKDQPSAVALVVEQHAMLLKEINSPSGPGRLQIIDTSLDPRSDGRRSFESENRIPEDELQMADKICHPEGLSVSERMQPRIVASIEGREPPSLLPSIPPGADASQDARNLVVEVDIQHYFDATSRGFPSASTTAASLPRVTGPWGQAQLEDEELEICLPIEEDEEVNEQVGTCPQNQIRRFWGSSNRDITPWKLLQKNTSQNT